MFFTKKYLLEGPAPPWPLERGGHLTSAALRGPWQIQGLLWLLSKFWGRWCQNYEGFFQGFFNVFPCVFSPVVFFMAESLLVLSSHFTSQVFGGSNEMGDFAMRFVSLVRCRCLRFPCWICGFGLFTLMWATRRWLVLKRLDSHSRGFKEQGVVNGGFWGLKGFQKEDLLVTRA